MKKPLINCLFVVLTAFLNTPSLKAQEKSNSLCFIENKGQWPNNVLYTTQLQGMNAWITRDGVVYDFYSINSNSDTENENNKPLKDRNKIYIRTGHVVSANNTNPNTTISAEPINKQTGYYNYIKGNDQKNWVSDVGLYKEVVIKNIYTGIDQRWYFSNGNLRYDYIVKPGADYTQIKLAIKGVDGFFVKNNELCFNTRFGEAKQAGLTVYEEVNGQKKVLKSNWVINNFNVQFEIANHNQKQTLVIDPLLYATYLGGSMYEGSAGITADNAGNSYITGVTGSLDFPTTLGAYQDTTGGPNDIFVSKLNVSGKALVYSTYIGGNGNDYSYAIALDANNNAYITGNSASTNFPVSTNAFQHNMAGGGSSGDVFVTKLNATGTALIYSTYIGGTDNDYGNAIVVDASNNAYITGESGYTGFPVTPGAYKSTYAGGGHDVIVTKLNSTGSALLYSTYIGGNDDEYSKGIDIDSTGAVYITGYTASANYPITVGAFRTTFTSVAGFDFSMFVTKLNVAGSALAYSTFLGGSNDNYGYAIAVDKAGYAYVTGVSDAPNFPVTSGAYQTTYAGGAYYGDIVVTKLNKAGSALIYSTYIGGTADDYGNSIAIDANGNAYITGRTTSFDFPLSTNALQTTKNGVNDAFVTMLNSQGTALGYSTYFGGSNADEGICIALDANDSIYVTGNTGSTDFPVTNGAYQVVYSDSSAYLEGVFVAKLGNNNVTTGISVLSKNQVEDIQIYPNPAKSYIIIQLPLNSTEQTKITLTDITGRLLIIEETNTSSQTLNTSNLSEGVYFVNVLRNNKTISVKKVVIEK